MPSCWTIGPGAAWSVEAGEHTGFHLSGNTAKKEGIQVDSPTVDFSHMTTATIIGSGPNGLCAAIVLAAAGSDIKVLGLNSRIDGACSTAETRLSGCRQDLGSSAYPTGFAGPFFRSLPVSIPWIIPPAQRAHPLDDGTAGLLEHSIEETVATLDSCDRPVQSDLTTKELAKHY